MYQAFIYLLQYLDSLEGIFNTIKRHSDGTLIVTVKKFKTAGYSREYAYDIKGLAQALQDVKEFVNNHPMSIGTKAD